jgi:hypothetical protein
MLEELERLIMVVVKLPVSTLWPHYPVSSAVRRQRVTLFT